MLFSSRRRRGSQRGYFTVIENNLAGEVFDPTLTTLVPTTVIWASSDGYTAVTTGTTHNISYTVPADGPRTWHIYCGIGLASIRTFDMRNDKLVHIDVSLLRSATSMIAHTNASLVMKLTDLPIGLTDAYFSYDPLLTGDIATLPIGLKSASFASDPLLTGDIATLPIGLMYAYFQGDLLLTAGSILNTISVRCSLLITSPTPCRIPRRCLTRWVSLILLFLTDESNKTR